MTRAGSPLRRLAALVLALAAAPALGANFTVRAATLQGWQIIPDGTVPYAFATGPALDGAGALQFGPIDGGTPANKFILWAPVADLATTSFTGFGFNFYVDPASLAGSDNYYINIYVDSIDNGIGTYAGSFYDCRYDMVASAGLVPGSWYMLAVTSATTAWTNVAAPGNCPSTLGGFPSGSLIRFIAVNAGQSTAGDAGLVGAIDRAFVETTSGIDNYDFEPDALVLPLATAKPVPAWSDAAGAMTSALLLAAAAIVLRRRRATRSSR